MRIKLLCLVKRIAAELCGDHMGKSESKTLQTLDCLFGREEFTDNQAEYFEFQILAQRGFDYTRSVGGVSIFGQERGKSRDVSHLRLPSAATYCSF